MENENELESALPLIMTITKPSPWRKSQKFVKQQYFNDFILVESKKPSNVSPQSFKYANYYSAPKTETALESPNSKIQSYSSPSKKVRRSIIHYTAPDLVAHRLKLNLKHYNTPDFKTLQRDNRVWNDMQILDAIYMGSGIIQNAQKILRTQFCGIPEMFTSRDDNMLFSSNECDVELLTNIKGEELCRIRHEYLMKE